jgi:hypothetical protein
MPQYTFALRDGTRPVEDGSGVPLPDRESAIGYAENVALELMRGCEAETRIWRLDVFDQNGEVVSQIPFASLDPCLAHFLPAIRQQIIDFGERRRELMEAMHRARATMLEARALVARSRGKPYLASHMGEPTIVERQRTPSSAQQR